ncbi:MAG: DUF2764 family protein [Parachlamydiaceae bacterium]
MANYYFLGTLLPDLNIGEKPEIGFIEFNRLLKENLTEADYAKTKALRGVYDIANLRFYWKGEPLMPAGNFSSSELEEALATHTMLPKYILDFIDKYPTNRERLHHFSELRARFFQEAISQATGFLKYYLTLEREMRLMMVAFRAKKIGRDLYTELQYEDPQEDFIAQILAQKDAQDYEPPEKYEEIKLLFSQYYDDPIELQKALIEYYFGKIDEKIKIELFSIDRILGYMIELIMVENWLRMDKQKGLEIVDSIVREPS